VIRLVGIADRVVEDEENAVADEAIARIDRPTKRMLLENLWENESFLLR